MIRSFSFATLAALVLTAAGSAFAAPRPAPRAEADIEAARAEPSSLFNRADANVQTSDTGGHIATVVHRSSANDSKVYGDRAQVDVEVTDPFGYFRGGEKTAPKAILANIASEKVLSGHDLGGVQQQGSNVTLTEVTKGVYRGTGTVEATLHQGDDMGVNLGKVSVSFAGRNGTWDSRYGQNYVAPTTTVSQK